MIGSTVIQREIRQRIQELQREIRTVILVVVGYKNSACNSCRISYLMWFWVFFVDLESVL